MREIDHLLGDRPLVSVIIVNWNGALYLHDCLTALYRQTLLPHEIIIVDNASTDHSCDIIGTFQVAPGAPVLRLIRNSENRGFAGGNNQGIRASSGDFVLALNADVTLAPNFLSELIALMRSDPTIGMTCGKLLNHDEPPRIDSTGLVIRKNRRGVDRGQGEIDHGQYDQIEEVFGGSGAACLYRRAMLEDVKFESEYFDELFFAYKEDIDLAWRARLFGWICLYTPSAIGWHHRKWGAGKRKNISLFTRRHSLKNRYLLLLKNDDWKTLLPCLIPILWFELLSLGYILLREPYLFSVINDIRRIWPQVLAKRRYIQETACQRTRGARLLFWFR